MDVLKIGAMAFSIPAKAESMCCWAMGNGTATHVIPAKAIRR